MDVPQKGDVQPHLKRPVGISETDGAGRAFLEDGGGKPSVLERAGLRPPCSKSTRNKEQGKCGWKVRGLENSPYAQLTSDSPQRPFAAAECHCTNPHILRGTCLPPKLPFLELSHLDTSKHMLRCSPNQPKPCLHVRGSGSVA